VYSASSTIKGFQEGCNVLSMQKQKWVWNFGADNPGDGSLLTEREDERL